MVLPCDESEGNHGNLGKGEEKHQEGPSLVVGRCKGMDRDSREGDVLGARGLCGLEKVCQLHCPNGLNSLWH